MDNSVLDFNSLPDIDDSVFQYTKAQLGEAFDEFAELYVSDVEHHLEVVKTFETTDQDLDALIQASHSLKSGGGMAGSVKMSTIAEYLEQHACALKAQNALEQSASLHHECEKLIEAGKETIVLFKEKAL